MELFDLFKCIFENPTEWKNVTPGEKRKWFFLVNRRFSIQFPMQANALQLNKINQVAVMDFWQDFMRKRYQKTPSWMYTKGVAKVKQEKEKKAKVSDAIINEYCKRMSIDKKSINDALEYFPDLMIAELQSWEKMVNQK